MVIYIQNISYDIGKRGDIWILHKNRKVHKFDLLQNKGSNILWPYKDFINVCRNSGVFIEIQLSELLFLYKKQMKLSDEDLSFKSPSGRQES